MNMKKQTLPQISEKIAAPLPAIAIDIKEDVGVVHVGEMKTVAIQINRHRLATAARAGDLPHSRPCL